MISWSSKIDIIGYYDNVLAEECRICTKKSKPVYKVEQAYFKLYGLALFPTKRTYYKTCGECNTQLKAKSNDSNLDVVKRHFPSQIKFKYVWGWLVLLPIVAFIFYLITLVK